MGQLPAEARLHFPKRAQSCMIERLQTVAIYSSLALIAAVVFGTLSVHPF
jgi:hypothetical protein